MRAEYVILLAVVIITAGALALEAVDVDGVRIVAITFCLLLVVLLVGGLVARVRVRMRGGQPDASEPTDAPDEHGRP